MNGHTIVDKSASWQQAVSVDIASILFMHCHHDANGKKDEEDNDSACACAGAGTVGGGDGGGGAGTLIMIANDGTQHPPLQVTH